MRAECYSALRILHSADITDLSGLIGIERVGSLEVFDNAQLQNIDGLSGIQGPVERLHALQRSTHQFGWSCRDHNDQ